MNLKNIFAGIVCLSITITAVAQDSPMGSMRKYRNEKKKEALVHRKNILGILPLMLTENGVLGIGMSYEHIIGDRGIVSWVLPVLVEFNVQGTEGPLDITTPNNGNNNPDPMYYINPGLKIYPTGAYGHAAKYAIGPSLVIADGQKSVEDNYYGGSYSVQDHFVIGMLINQSININATPHLYIAGEFGVGYSYVDRVGGVEQGTQALLNFNFKIGYRF